MERGVPKTWLKWGLGSVLAVGILGFLVAPPLIQSIAEKQLGEALHRPVSMEGLSINPYALSAEVRGLRIGEREGDGTAASLGALYANLSAESLFRGGVVVEEIRIVEPAVSVVRVEASRYNWSDVIEDILNKPDDGSKSYFAIHNIRIEKGRLDLDDRVLGQRHSLSDLDLGLPFVSNLPAQVDSFVEPALALKVDGVPFEIRGRAKPFSARRETVVDIGFKDFDLTPYLQYLPIERPFLLPSARLSSKLELSFAQPAGQQPDVVLKGSVGLTQLELQDAKAQPALKFASLQVGVERLAPLAGEVALGQVSLDGLELHVSRSQDSQISLRALIPRLTRQVQAIKQGEPPAPAPQPDKPLALRLGEFRLNGGTLFLTDKLKAGTYKKTVKDIQISLRKLALPSGDPAELDFSLATDAGESMTHQGHLGLSPLRASGDLVLKKLDIPAQAPYFAAALGDAQVASGKLDGQLAYEFSLQADDPAVKIRAQELALGDFALRLKGDKDALAKLARLAIRDAQVDTVARQVTVAAVEAKAGRVALIRDALGHFNVERVVAAQPAAGAAPQRPVPKGGKVAAAGPAWQVALGRLDLDGWGLRIEDRSLTPAIVFNADPLALRVEGLSTAKGSKARVTFKSTINQRGKIGLAGTVGLAPLAGSFDLDLKAVDLAMLQPYVTERIKIAITRGQVSSRSRLTFEQPDKGLLKAGFKGDLTIGDFASVDKLNAADFLKWKSLYFGGVDFRLSPMALSIDDIALSEFYTRLILDARGGLNIREITAQRAQAEKDGELAARKAGATPPAAPPVAASPAEPLPPILIKRITLQGGNIAYSDRFIKPNYDANLTGMGGRLNGLSSDPGTIAELDLRGRVDRAAPVEVTGRFNPFRQDKALDIRALVKDFELSGVSTYAAKYVGYGIEKGKLSANLNYKVEDRKLTATNQVFLDQLTFGDKVDSPDALKLPVLLAVSLLKNRRGEIDLDLPISGTLDDPEFSVGALVVKVIVNLIGKAISSPFALLGSVFGGDSEELAWVDFQPGFARLDEDAETKLKAIARAMNDKGSLKLEVAGRVDPLNDRDGLKRAIMLSKVEALKVADMVKKGESAAGEDGEVRIDPAEYPALLTRVYKNEKFPKPRNMIGLTKDIPVNEMEKLILANTQAEDEDLRLLGQRRAQVVKNWLLEQGKVPAERIFLLSTREGDDGKHAKAKISRADFSLR